MYLKTFEDMQKSSVLFMLKPIKAVYYFITIIFVSLILFLIWSFFAPIDDSVKVTVLLRPATTISSVKCITSGQIYSKNFYNNEIVEENDLLFSLDTTSLLKQLETYQSELFKNKNDIEINEAFMETIESMQLPNNHKNSNVYLKCSSYLTEYKCYENNIKNCETKLNRERNKPESLLIPQIIQDLEAEYNQNILVFESWKSNQKF